MIRSSRIFPAIFLRKRKCSRVGKYAAKCGKTQQCLEVITCGRKNLKLNVPNEDFKDKTERLKKLVVDYKPKPEFKAGVLLTEMEYPEFPGYMARTITVYFAPEQYLSTYLDEKIYASQKIEQKEIGVDSARYLIDVFEDMSPDREPKKADKKKGRDR